MSKSQAQPIPDDARLASPKAFHLLVENIDKRMQRFGRNAEVFDEDRQLIAITDDGLKLFTGRLPLAEAYVQGVETGSNFLPRERGLVKSVDVQNIRNMAEHNKIKVINTFGAHPDYINGTFDLREVGQLCDFVLEALRGLGDQQA